MQSISLLLLTFAALVCLAHPDSHAQMLSRRPNPGDIERWESPDDSVAAKEKALIQEVLEPELVLRVHPTRSKIVRTKRPVGRMVIGNPDVVDVNEFDQMELEIIGKRLGETTLSLWFPNPDGNPIVLRYLVQVVEHDGNEKAELSIRALQNQINELFPNSQVTLTLVRQRIVVRGQARDSQEAQNILSLIGQNGNRYGQSGTNNRGMQGNQGANGLLNDPLNQNNGNGTGNRQFGRNGNNVQIINLLRVPGVQQVMLKVRVAELSRQSARELGTDLKGVLGSLTLGTVIDSLDDFTAILEGDDVRLFLRAFASHGYGKILAEPTLVTISGKTARFLAGGEFAVPTTVGIGGASAASTEFRGFGTELEFTPTVVDKDLIRLEVSPSFSTLNGNATVNGIPGLNRRVVETTVDLREGQWLAIAGLIQDEQGGNRSRLPYLGNIPHIGGLFGRQGTTRDETELIVLVSPELVHPMEPEQVPLILPGMDVTDPTDDDFFRRNLTEGYSGHDHRSTVWSEIDLQTRTIMRESSSGIGHRLRCEQEYISGPVGFSD